MGNTRTFELSVIDPIKFESTKLTNFNIFDEAKDYVQENGIKYYTIVRVDEYIVDCVFPSLG